MKTVTVGSVTFGEGLPKIIAPIAETTERRIYHRAKEYICRQTDIVEWRADHFVHIHDTEDVLRVMKKLHRIMEHMPWIFTCRTTHEAGEAEMEKEEYLSLYRMVIESGYADAIDIETERYCDEIRDLIALAHEKGVAVIGSDVFPDETPVKDTLVERMRIIQDMDADIVKIAAMTQCSKDMITVLDASREMVEEYADRPVIAIGMGSHGVLTRVACEFVGTSGTYGAIREESAPGQFRVERLDNAIRILHAGILDKV